MSETKARKPQVVARLTLAQPNHVKLIVEVPEGASFHQFYHWYRQEGRKRKVFLRTSNRNDGIKRYYHGGFDMPGLDVLAARVTSFSKTVTGVTVKVLRKRKYNALLTCAPDELGTGLPTAAIVSTEKPRVTAHPRFFGRLVRPALTGEPSTLTGVRS